MNVTMISALRAILKTTTLVGGVPLAAILSDVRVNIQEARPVSVLFPRVESSCI